MMRTTNTDVKRLHKLNDLNDYEVSDNDPDIVDWKVYTSDKIEFGEVEDLVVDINIKKAVYADVIVSDDFMTGDSDSHLLIPLDSITVYEKNKMVIVNSLSSEELAKYPMYNGAHIPGDYEKTLREKLIERGGSSSSGTGFTRGSDSGSFDKGTGL
jgi:sporulation protein YlmC with PRC-barrel domain